MTGHLVLAPLDIAVVALFVAAILGLGFSARLRDNSVLQYLAAGRSLSLPAFVATLVSTWYGGILGVAESVQFFGIGAWLLIGVPYYIFGALYALSLSKRVRAADQISLPERLDLRWGRGAGVVGAILVFLLAVPAAHVLMLGVLTQLITGWHLSLAVPVAAVVGTLFLYRGGLLADVRASLLAFVGMYVGFAVLLGWCLAHFPPGEAWQRLDPSLKRWDGGGGWLQVASFFILGAWTLVDPGFHQRVASARSPEVSRAGVLVSVGFWMLFDLLSIGTALYAMTLLDPIPSGLTVYPLFGDAILPPGLKALFFCGMIGTILSAMVGYTLISGASFGREIVGRVRPGLDDAGIKSWTRVGIALATVVAIGLGLQLESVVALWYAWGGAVVGALLLPVLLAYGSRASRVSAGWAVASMAIAFAVSFSWLAYGQRTNNPYLEVGFIEGRLSLPPFPSGAQVTRFGLGTLVPGLVISGLVMALGRLAGRRKAYDGRTDQPAGA